MQHADKWQVPKTLGKIEAVTDDKIVRDFEADEISLNGFEPARGFIEEDAGLDPAGFQGAELTRDQVESFACVEDVVDEQNVAPAHIEAQFLGENEFAGFSASAIAGDAHEIQAKRQGKAANEIGQKHNRAVEQRDDHHFASFEIGFNF